MSWRGWILAARPKTLTAAMVPIAAASALVKAMNLPLQIWISVFALAASLFIQVGTNLVNDAADFKKGADTDTRLGPQRVTQSGVFSYPTVMLMAGFCFLVAIGFGLPLVLHGGLPILIIGVLAVLFGYAYTSGPFPLAYLGLGDVFVIIFFGLVAVSGLVFLQTGQWLAQSHLLGLQVGLHATVLIAINNLRDMQGDVLVGKKTLPVRLGLNFGRWEIATLCLLPFLLNIFWLEQKLWAAFVLPFLALPLAIKIIFQIFKTEPSSLYNKFLGMAAGLHLIFGTLLSLGLMIG